MLLYSCMEKKSNSQSHEKNEQYSPTPDTTSYMNLKPLLEETSMLMLERKEFELSSGQIESKWVGNKPATDSEIQEAENRLKLKLPGDYKAFLKLTNGFPASSSVEPTFAPVSEINYLKKLDPELIEIWHENGTSDIALDLERSILIAGLHEEQLFLIIPPETDGQKWTYWKFASWIPGEHEYNNLIFYFEKVNKFLKETHKN